MALSFNSAPVVRTLALGILLTLGGASATGCVGRIPPTAAQAPSKYYVLTVEADRRARGEALDNKAESLAADADQLVNEGIKIAFQPPDRCLTTTATPEGAVKKEDYIGMECGVLMASLELAAAKSGYEVVSWQGLKDPAKRPLSKAAELNVNVLVEVNELSANERQSGKSSYTGLSFHEQSNLADRHDLSVQPEVAQTCKAYVDQMVKSGYLDLEENSATLDAKAVDVKTGRAIWYYSKTIREEEDQQELPESDFYYEAPASAPPVLHVPKYNSLQTFGIIFSPVGGALTMAGAGLYVGAGLEGVGTGLLALGLTSVTFGVTALVIGNVVNRRYNRATAASPSVGYTPAYAAPAAVLCSTPAVRPPFLPSMPAAAPTEPQSSSSYSFTEQTSGSGDAERALRERLIKMVAQDFVDELTKLN